MHYHSKQGLFCGSAFIPWVAALVVRWPGIPWTCVRVPVAAASLTISSPHLYRAIRGAQGVLPMTVGGATSQLDLPSLTPLYVVHLYLLRQKSASDAIVRHSLQLGVPYLATSVDSCKLLIIDPTFYGSWFSTGRLLAIEDFTFYLYILWFAEEPNPNPMVQGKPTLSIVLCTPRQVLRTPNTSLLGLYSREIQTQNSQTLKLASTENTLDYGIVPARVMNLSHNNIRILPIMRTTDKIITQKFNLTNISTVFLHCIESNLYYEIWSQCVSVVCINFKYKQLNCFLLHINQENINNHEK